MKKDFFLLLMLFFIVSKSSAQKKGCIDSSNRFFLQVENARIIIQASTILKDSGIVIVGHSRNIVSGDSSFFLTKFDKYNRTVFSKRINKNLISTQQIREANNGDILVATSNNVFANERRTILLRFDNNGNIKWQKSFENINTVNNVNPQPKYCALYENQQNEIFAATTYSSETNKITGELSGYYNIYKLSSNGELLWETTLVQNKNSSNAFNAIKQSHDTVYLVSIQDSENENSLISSRCSSLFQLNSITGTLLKTASIHLNLGCSASWGNSKQSVNFTTDGKIILTGNNTSCSNEYFPSYLIITDNNFNILNNWKINYSNALGYNNYGGTTLANEFNQIFLFSKGYSANKTYYATININGKIIQQRKVDLSPLTFNPSANISAAFKNEKDFILFCNLKNNNEEVTQIVEFKGNNNEMINCTGEDTSFISLQPLTLQTSSFIIDTIKKDNYYNEVTNYAVEDFLFLRTEVCSSYSICDTLKIHGKQFFCMDEPEQIFTIYKNPGCNKKTSWIIDTSVILSRETLNDTTLKIKFKKSWSGYLYNKSSSCDALSDSLFITVSESVKGLNLGNDTVFCKPFILDAGSNYKSYRWQDNSTDRYFTVSEPGKYFVIATDFCGNSYSDSILFKQKESTLFIGNDTCVSIFPLTISANSNFDQYKWSNGSSNQSIKINAAGLYYVNTVNTCKESFQDSILVNEEIQPFNLGKDTTICQGSVINLTPPKGFLNYQWQDNSSKDIFTVKQAGEYFVSVSDYCNHIQSDTILIKSLLIKITLPPDTTICKFQTLQLTAKPENLLFEWSPDLSINNTQGSKVIVNPTSNISYIVTAEIFAGCELHDTININVIDCSETIFVPSAFTPNHDGTNDMFKPIISGPVENYKFLIFNRYGEIVFESAKVTEGWNGVTNGIPLPPGIFTWTISLKRFSNNETQILKGSILLIR